MLLRLTLMLLLGVLFASPTAEGQPNDGDPPTFGLGVHVPPTALASSSTDLMPLGFTIPITFGRVRLDPQVGYHRQSQSQGSQSETTSSLLFGTGAFYRRDVDDTLLLIGARIGVLREGQTFDARSTPEETIRTVDLFFGPAVGGEHYISDHFSVGAEARLLYRNRGQPEEAAAQRSASVVRTSSAAFLRFHF